MIQIWIHRSLAINVKTNATNLNNHPLDVVVGKIGKWLAAQEKKGYVVVPKFKEYKWEV